MLAELVPAPMVRLFARPYVAGGSMDVAVDAAARELETRGLLTTLDLLGEHVTEAAQVEANARIYGELIRAVAADPRFSDARQRPTVSVKPSAFCAGDDKTEAFGPIRRLAEIARDARVGLTVDMEDHPWTDVTLDAAIGLFREGFDVGTVLQTRLERTEADLARIPAGMRIRLVIGIYPEPPDIATTDKRLMKERMVEAAATLVDRGAYVEFATHDDAYVERFVREVAVRAPDRCEVQLLLGVPRSELIERLRRGDLGAALPVRLYVPFAVSWADATAYLRRRMAESPSIVWLVLRNLFRSG